MWSKPGPRSFFSCKVAGRAQTQWNTAGLEPVSDFVVSIRTLRSELF